MATRLTIEKLREQYIKERVNRITSISRYQRTYREILDTAHKMSIYQLRKELAKLVKIRQTRTKKNQQQIKPKVEQPKVEQPKIKESLTWEQIQPKLYKVLNKQKYVYYTRAIAHYINTDNEKLQRKEKITTTIKSDKSMEKYVEQVYNWLFEYNYLKTEEAGKWILVKVNIEISKKINGRTKLFRVAHYEAENCVVNVIRGYLGNKTDKVYEKYPALKPEENQRDPIFVDCKQLDEIAKTLNINIQTYTALGAKLNQPWDSFGTKGKKKIPIKIHNEHATIIPGKLSVSEIRYHEYLEVPSRTSVVDEDYFYSQNPNDTQRPKYFTELLGGKLIMNKQFRPSSVSTRAEDDSDLDLAYIFTTEQMMYHLFKLKYNLKTIPDNNIRQIVKSSEHFVGKRVLEPLTNQKYTEVDHNKSYVSFEQSPYYIGFPTNNLTPVKPEFARNPAFYIISNMSNVPRCFQLIFNYESGPIVLAQPTYEFLLDQNTQIDIDYILDGEFQHISIVDFANSFEISDDDKKLFRNQLIGRTITGGLKEVKCEKYRYKNESERDQLVYEAQTNDLPYAVDEEYNTVTIQQPKIAKGFFNFHSYILAYSSAQLMAKWIELESKFQIVAYNVDAIVLKDNYFENSNEIGQWKSGPLKNYYRQFKVNATITPREYQIPQIPVTNYDPPRMNTIITGPAGIGKSHKWKIDPLYDQIILTPTHELKYEHKQLFQNTLTAAKYFQFTILDDKWQLLRKTGKIPREHRYIILDEFTMFNEQQWEIIKRRQGNSIIIALGDFEQIRNSIGANCINREYFDHQQNWQITELQRTPDIITRHQFEYGQQLDQLRGLSIHDQSQFIQTSDQWQRINEDLVIPNCDITTDKIIVGTHTRAHKFNLEAVNHAQKNNMLFPFRTVGKQPKVVYLPVDTLGVWWDRKSMNNDDMPKGTKYEPYFAVTADSFQGKTVENLNMIYVDINSLTTRHGALYTSMTRTRSADNLLIIN